ncbi:MAG: sigma-54-dependent transcriptional regulator [Candidatus Hydrogenedentota bacterium]
MAKHRILVIDDEELMREYVEEAMARAGHRVDAVGNGPDGVALVEKNTYDVVITDLKMTPMDGIAVLRQVRTLSPDTAVIMMTAYGTIENAVAALREGASDYILKPFTPEAIEVSVDRVLESQRLSEENRYLRKEVNAPFNYGAMVGTSPAMLQVYAQIKKVAGTRATVLIRGESGTGKELVARAIHYGGGRRDRPFVKVNCAALSAGILESELFGHEKGAFTSAHERKIGRFELADTGTLLLDEVSEINRDLQPKLLRALQEREFERVGGNVPIQVDTHILATSNRDLEQAVQEGAFRQDLFFRLNVITLHLPPLRKRREDIPPLINHFLQRYNQENGKHIREVTPEARKLLTQYDWPGNVRELQNAIERAVVLTSDDVLDTDLFALGLAPAATPIPGNALAIRPGATVAEMERRLILATLEHCNQNRTQTAEMLGISVRTLRNKLNEYQG